MLHCAGRSASQGRALLTSTAGSCPRRVNQRPNVNTGELLGSCASGRAPDPRRAHAGERLPALSRGRLRPPCPPAPVPPRRCLGRGSVGQGGGRRGGGAGTAPSRNTPTFLPEERRRPEGSVSQGATPERHRRDIFFPFDTSDFFTWFFFFYLYLSRGLFSLIFHS